MSAAVEQIELCLTMFGIVPDLIMAPGFSQDATVAAVMDAKAGSINGMFTGKALVDISAKTLYRCGSGEKQRHLYRKDHPVLAQWHPR